MALNGAFSIFYIISQNPEASIPQDADLALDPGLAGITHVFAAPVEACDNCGIQSELATVVTNTVPITSLLLDYVRVGELSSMEPDNVRPFLVQRLKWRILGINGNAGNTRTMAERKGFKVNISVKISRLPRGSDDVRYETYPEVIDEIIANASAAPTV